MDADLIGDVADADVLSAELDEFVNGVLGVHRSVLDFLICDCGLSVNVKVVRKLAQVCHSAAHNGKETGKFWTSRRSLHQPANSTELAPPKGPLVESGT
jgi:hypothetical protein